MVMMIMRIFDDDDDNALECTHTLDPCTYVRQGGDDYDDDVVMMMSMMIRCLVNLAQENQCTI